MKKFEEIYNGLLNDKNSELNISWKEAKKEYKKANRISLIACFGIAIVYLIKDYKNIMFSLSQFNIINLMFTILPLVILEIFAFVLIKLIFSKKNNKYNKVYKNQVIKTLINNFYDKVEYFPQKEIPEYIYKEGKYDYIEDYNKYFSEDYIEAFLQNRYSIQMAEIKTQKEETKINDKGEKETTVITKFHGLFSKITIDKSINNTLRISQNGKAFLQNNKLKMDSSEFENYFDVQASDKILGMRILTADVMEELVEFQNKTNVKYDIYIENDNLYLRFHLGNMFEPRNLKNAPIDKKDVEKYFYALNFTYNLSNKIIKIIEDVEI